MEKNLKDFLEKLNHRNTAILLTMSALGDDSILCEPCVPEREVNAQLIGAFVVRKAVN